MDSKTKLICIIEDNNAIRKLFCTILKKSGLNTIDFPDGSSAVKWLNDNIPDAIILDILLPDSNGTELLKIIRKMPLGNTIPIIAVTGFAKTNDKEKYLEMGFDSYFSKPINTVHFANDVNEIIKMKSQVSPNDPKNSN